jgi:hypothetical protein
VREICELREEGFLAVAQSELMYSDATKYELEQWQSYSEMENFDNFTVDVEMLFQSNGLILGSRHTGKSDVAMKVSDKVMQKNAVVMIFDPSRDWIERSAIPRVMTVEPNAILDVPNESVIFDVSLLSPNKTRQIVEAFCKRLFEYQASKPKSERRQYVMFFEECHTYFYQNCMRSKNSENTVKTLSVGRNVSISCLLISQFASMIDKFAVKHALSQSWYGFTREPNDLKYLEGILGKKAKQLTKLNDGEFLFLNRSNLKKIQIEPYESSVAKKQIVIPETKPIEPIKPLPKSQTNNYVLIKAGVILCIGLLWALMTLR